MATLVTAGGSGDDLTLERILYQRTTETAGQHLAALLQELLEDVEHLRGLRDDVMANLPPLDAEKAAAVDAQRLTPWEEAAATATVEQLAGLDDSEALWALEQVVRAALEQEEMQAYLYEPGSDVHAQILERRHIMLQRIQTAAS